MLTLYRNWPMFIDTNDYEIRPKKHLVEKILERKRSARESYLNEAERLTGEIKELEKQLE